MSKKYHYGSDPNQMVDEWGDPIKAPAPQGPQETVVDEWGDPVKKVRVNQTTEEFVKEKERLALERELVAQGLIYPRSHYLPRGRFRGILAVCLAFLFGMFVCLGALVGVGAWLGTKTKLSGLLGDKAAEWLNPEYADMSVLDLVTTVVGDLQGGVDCLDDIAKYTPAVDKLLGLLEENVAALGIDFNDDLKTQFKSTPFTGIGSFLVDDVLKTVELGKVLQVTPSSDPVMVGLCYGEEGEDYTVDGDAFVMNEGHTATTIGDLMDSPTDIISTMRLGTLMGLNKDVTDQKLKDNAMMYALCYGKRGENAHSDADYYVDGGKIVVIKDGGAEKLADEIPADEGGEEYVHAFPTTVGDLMNHSNAVINSLELGTMLGIDIDVTEQKIEDNGMMYALSYGSRGVDWQLNGGAIEMLDGHNSQYPTQMKAFTEDSSKLIEGLEVETLMGVTKDSDKLMHYLAYGPELQKGKEPYSEDGGRRIDADGKPVDAHGYLLDEDGGYRTEPVLDEEGRPTDESQYVGGGRFIYEYGEGEESGTVKGIQMLSDPATGKPFPKKTVADLTAKDANILENMKIGDAMEITEGSSALMRAMSSWTIGDLKKPEKIDSLKLSEVLGNSDSKIMQALANKTLGDMKKQETIEALTLGDVLDIHDKDVYDENDPSKLVASKSSGLLIAMKDWKLSDLQNQHRIERLKIGNVITVGEGTSSLLMQAIKDWRIGDLSKQEKIDSLTLGDVIDTTGSDGILASLADSPIGSMQASIDKLTLADMLGADAVAGNKILKHLANSTVNTLSDDMQNLSIGEVFADEVFSFMEIKKDTDGTYKEETGQDTGGDITYQVLLKYYTKNHSNEGAGKARPEPYKIKVNEDDTEVERKLSASDKGFETYYVLKSSATTTLTPQYYEDASNSDSAYKGEDVKTAPATEKDRDTPYYYEKKITVTPKYEYQILNYSTGNLEELREGASVTESADGDKIIRTYHDGTATYDIIDNGFDLYFTRTVEKEGVPTEETVYLDYVQTGYEETLPEGADVRFDKTEKTYYYTVEVPLYLRYWSGAGSDKLYEQSEVIEKYRYTDKENNVHELDRYFEGVWYMLLADEDGNVDTTVSILDMDKRVTNVNSSLTDTPLWTLYFHGILVDDPYVQFASAVTFEHQDAGASKPTSHTVNNLNEVKISELVALVKALMKTP